MVEIYGPECPLKIPKKPGSGIVIKSQEPLRTNANTLAEALDAYAKEFRVRFRPYDGSLIEVPFGRDEPHKYFFHEKADGDCFLVDVHIERGSEEICPKQDLGVILRPGDRVRIGHLVC